MSRSMIIVMWTSDLIVKDMNMTEWTSSWPDIVTSLDWWKRDGWERGFSVTVGVLFQLFGGDWPSGPSSSPLVFVSARRNWATLPQLVFKTLVARSIGIAQGVVLENRKDSALNAAFPLSNSRKSWYLSCRALSADAQPVNQIASKLVNS